MNKKTLPLYEFDDFRVDTRQRCLWYADELVSLTPKAFETLLVLIKHRGEVVGKDVLLDEVWEDTFVEESTLAQNILTLRKTLGVFQKDKQFIVTVPRRGYRFVADVKERIAEDEIFVVEKHTRTHIVAEQQAVHDSAETKQTAGSSQTKQFAGRKQLVSLAVFTVIVFVSGFFALRYFLKPPNFAASNFQKFEVKNLFSSGEIQNVTISPNGKYIASIERKNGRQSLLLRQIESGSAIETVPPSDLEFIGAAFSKDSDQIYYSAYSLPENSAAKVGKLYKVPIFGGAPQEILRDVDSTISLSPDEKQIAFIRHDIEKKESRLMVSGIDGKNEKIITSRKFSDGFMPYGVSWSPDGKMISCAAANRTNPENPMELIVVNAENGEQKSLTPENWLWIGQSAWLSDGSGIALVAYGTKSPNLTDEIWIVSYPEGRARVISQGINGIFGVSMTDDAKSIVTAKLNKITSFKVSPIDNLNKSTELLKIIGEEGLLPLGADFAPDGKIIYSHIQNGNADIWTISADGQENKQMTSEPSADFSPAVSADGRFIVFISNRSGVSNIWRMNMDGTNPKQLTDLQIISSPNVSPDGNWVYFTARTKDSNFALWKVSIDGNSAVKLSEIRVFSPKISPDGKIIAGLSPAAESLSRQLKLTFISTEDGKILRQIDGPSNNGQPQFEWKNDSQALYLVLEQDGKTSLWLQPANGNQAAKIKDWEKDKIFRFAVSKDGKQVFYEEGTQANSVLLLQDK